MILFSFNSLFEILRRIHARDDDILWPLSILFLRFAVAWVRSSRARLPAFNSLFQIPWKRPKPLTLKLSCFFQFSFWDSMAIGAILPIIIAYSFNSLFEIQPAAGSTIIGISTTHSFNSLFEIQKKSGLKSREGGCPLSILFLRFMEDWRGSCRRDPRSLSILFLRFKTAPKAVTLTRA